MKRNYVMMAMAAAMLASCAQTGLVEEIAEEPQKAIGFSTFVDKATRAENSDQTYSWNLHSHHTTFNVWSYKSVADEKVFDGDVVTYKDVAGSDPLTQAWQYDQTRYWDKAASWYEFYAAAPSNVNWVLNEKTLDKDDDYFTFNSYELKGDNLNSNGFSTYNESFNSLSNDVDLMIAASKKVDNANFGKEVELEFIHILSRLNIIVKKDNIVDDQVNLVRLDVVDLKNIGSFDESAITGTLANGITGRWTTADNYTTITYEKNEEVTTSEKYAIQALVIPQDVKKTTNKIELDGSNITAEKKPYIRIEYTITPTSGPTETFVAYYNLAAAFTSLETPADIAFNEGWQNTLTITIQPSKIEFAAKLASWGETSKVLPIK